MSGFGKLFFYNNSMIEISFCLDKSKKVPSKFTTGLESLCLLIITMVPIKELDRRTLLFKWDWAMLVKNGSSTVTSNFW